VTDRWLALGREICKAVHQYQQKHPSGSASRSQQLAFIRDVSAADVKVHMRTKETLQRLIESSSSDQRRHRTWTQPHRQKNADDARAQLAESIRVRWRSLVPGIALYLAAWRNLLACS